MVIIVDNFVSQQNGKEMIIEKEILIEKSVKEAWKVLGLDFADAYKWASAVNHSEAIGDNFNGTVCTERGCSTTMGGIKERLLAFSNDDYSLKYEVVEGKPQMIAYATNSWKLSAIEPHKCVLNIKMEIITKGFWGTFLQPILKIKMASMGQDLVEDFKYYVENKKPHPRKTLLNSEQNLKKYLSVNSLFSGICGLIMILFTISLNDFFHLKNEYIFPVIGVNLLIFSAFVFYVSTKQLSNIILVKIITILDVFWVLGSITIVLFGLFDLPTKGYFLISIIALWIAFLAQKQYVYSKK
jgi:hypothetical protein